MTPSTLIVGFNIDGSKDVNWSIRKNSPNPESTASREVNFDAYLDQALICDSRCINNRLTVESLLLFKNHFLSLLLLLIVVLLLTLI